jgi:hypothetical protein
LDAQITENNHPCQYRCSLQSGNCGGQECNAGFTSDAIPKHVYRLNMEVGGVKGVSNTQRDFVPLQVRKCTVDGLLHDRINGAGVLELAGAC